MSKLKRLETQQFNADLVVSRYTLTNGLQVLHQPDHGSPVLAYQSWFRVGSAYERPGRTGMAHLFEHLMFKGSKNQPEGAFDRRLEEVGARVNAATWLDWTFYYEEIPSAFFPELVELEADRLENMRLNTEQLELERKVVMNERREQVEDQPDSLMSEHLWALAFKEHSYGWPTIGWMEDIQSISLSDCLEFQRHYYSPNNLIICVVGDLPASELERIAAAYGHLEPQEIPPLPRFEEPYQSSPRREVLSLPLSGDRLLMGFPAPAALDPLHPALEVLNEILFEGDSARLQRSLVTEGEQASGIFSFVPLFQAQGLYELGVDLRAGIPAEAAEVQIMEALERIRCEGLSEKDLEKACNKLETRFYRQLQSNQSRAQSLGFWQVLGDFRQMFRQAAGYRQVNSAQVQNLLERFLRPEACNLVIGRAS